MLFLFFVFRLTIANVWGDSNLVCPTILFGEEYAKHLSSINHVYAYRLMQTVPFLATHGPKWIVNSVPHGIDVVYLFMFELLQSNPYLRELSIKMIQEWTVFAKTGKVSYIPGASSHWLEAFDREAKDYSTRYYHLESSNYKFVSGYFKETCDAFWKPKIFV